jgi:hypothetical protein
MILRHIWTFAAVKYSARNVSKLRDGFISVRQPAISPTPLTRHFPYCSDKLSRLAPPSKSIVCRSHHGIRSLAEGGPLAPVLLRRLALVRFQATPYKAIPSRSQKMTPGPQRIPGVLVVLAPEECDGL